MYLYPETVDVLLQSILLKKQKCSTGISHANALSQTLLGRGAADLDASHLQVSLDTMQSWIHAATPGESYKEREGSSRSAEEDWRYTNGSILLHCHKPE